MKLSTNDKDLLCCIEMRAATPLSAIARELRRTESAVRYQLRTLIDDGVIIRRRYYLNPYVLGLTNYAIYFSLDSGRQSDRLLIADFLPKIPEVTWFATLGGPFEYAISVSARHISEVITLFDTLPIRLQRLFFRKTVSVRAAIHTFPRAYLSTKTFRFTNLFQGGAPGAAIDQTDHRVLSALSHSKFESQRELAETAGLPPSTFARRIRRLEELGVLSGAYYIFDPSKLGVQEYRLLISTGGASKQLEQKLRQFSRAHREVRKFLECIGPWDYEMEASSVNHSSITDLVSLLHQQFPGKLESIQSLPIFSEISCSSFPLPAIPD